MDKPTHISKAGVEVVVRHREAGWHVVKIPGVSAGGGMSVTENEFALLFEEIKPEPSVEIGLHDAQMLRDHFSVPEQQRFSFIGRLNAAIERAAKEQA